MRDLEVYSKLTQGFTTREVAAEHGIDHTTVSRIGHAVDKWLRPQWMEHILDIRVRHCESLMHVFQEAMAAWEKSKTDAVTITEKSGNSGGEKGGPYDEKATQTKAQAGNPSFLAEARSALAEVRKIWGADAPAKTEVSTGGGFGGKPLDEMRADYYRGKLLELEEAKRKQLEPQPN